MDVALPVPFAATSGTRSSWNALSSRSSKSTADALPEQLVVPLVYAQRHLVEVVPDPLREPLRGDQPALRARYPRLDGARSEALRVDLDLLHHRLDQRDLVRVVVDHEVADQTDRRPVPAQEHRAEGVEGPSEQITSIPAEERRRRIPFAFAEQPLPHLPRRLVREGQRRDAPRLHPALADEVGDAVRDNPRLAAARPRDDQKRAAGRQDGFALPGVQPFEDIGRHRHQDHTTAARRISLHATVVYVPCSNRYPIKPLVAIVRYTVRLDGVHGPAKHDVRSVVEEVAGPSGSGSYRCQLLAAEDGYLGDVRSIGTAS